MFAKTKRLNRSVIRTFYKAFLVWYCFFSLPEKLFNNSCSTVLLDHDGNLLCARIADDGQWRFPHNNDVPDKFKTCLLQFEDRNFESHFGVSFKGLGRAVRQNVSAGKVVSGGSTLTMQLARLMRKNPPRTLSEKMIEIILATRIECSYSKSQILSMYASNAPFGSNVVGLDAASWRYYGRPAEKLSWAESATLAVLPNAPGLIHPGKNRKRLVEKRNRLLSRLHEIKVLDDESYELALAEPLPEKPLLLPQLSTHLLDRAIHDGYKGTVIKTTIRVQLQKQVNEMLAQHHEMLSRNEIHNGAVLILSVKTGEVLAYAGNTKVGMADEDNEDHGFDVDLIPSYRSSGSTLKPFLYARMMDQGELMPKELVPDIPTQIGGYSPKNFAPTYDGAVPANRALARSLNIPAVRMLNEYGVEKFRKDLKKLGFKSVNKSADHYGLSLILGGAEVSLWDLCSAYGGLSNDLQNYNRKNDLLFSPHYTVIGKRKKSAPGNELVGLKAASLQSLVKSDKRNPDNENSFTAPACIYETFNALLEVNRPDEEGNWKSFETSKKIAWKTGTSFGFRDAWAIGVTPEYVVGVWVGNADGEGRPGLTGIKSAAPLMFDVYAALPHTTWFKAPEKEMTKIAVCRMSGHRAGDNCEITDTLAVPNTCLNTTVCPYHQMVHLDKKQKFRVNAECENLSNMVHKKWFVLPAIIEKFYKFNNPEYKLLPDFRCDCLQEETKDKSLALIYPRKSSKIFLPVTFEGLTGKTVFEAAHRVSGSKIFWHLDNQFIGETKDIHQLEFCPAVGKHKLLVTDEAGRTAGVYFEVIGKNE